MRPIECFNSKTAGKIVMSFGVIISAEAIRNSNLVIHSIGFSKVAKRTKQ
jgi:hypothetical protein